jgi:CRISPR/Cas system CMR-associated protein Cmr5 small subunit
MMTGLKPFNESAASPLRVYSIGDENLLIEAMVPTERQSTYAYLVFNAAMIQQISSFEDKNAQMILHNGTSIPVAMDPRELQEKVSKIDFKSGNKLDLTKVTGEAVKITWPENMVPGQLAEDGSIYLGFHEDLDWYAADKDAVDQNGSRLSLKFKEAADYADKLQAHGKADWEVPKSTILHEIQKALNKGKFYNTFDTKDDSKYWSSTHYSDGYKAVVRFYDCKEIGYSETGKIPLRCVRHVPRP